MATNSREPRTKTQEEDSKNTEEAIKTDIKEESIESIAQSLTFINIDDWQDILPILDPSRLKLTKEEYSLINARIAVKEFQILHNIYEFLGNLSTNQCMLDRLIQLFVISKIGAILLQFKQNRIQAILTALQVQGSMYTALVNAIATVAGLIPSVAFNPVANVKWSAVFTTLTTALALTGTEIGNLKTNLRNLIRDNEFCIKSCLCPDTIPLGVFKEGVEQNHNEQIQVALAKLEELINKELDELLKQEIITMKKENN
jgi:hypothetical protein